MGGQSARQSKDLVGLAKLFNFAFQRLHALLFCCGGSFALAGIVLVLAHPALLGLRFAADLGRDGLNGCPLRLMLPRRFLDHTHSALHHFREKFGGFTFHGPILSNVEASQISGTVHMLTVP